MSQIQVQKGTIAIDTFETLSYANGPRVAPDSPPTVLALHVNGVINSTLTSAATIANMQDATPANITGYYKLTFASSSLAVGDDIHVTISATISGVVATAVKRFLIINADTTTPVIR